MAAAAQVPFVPQPRDALLVADVQNDLWRLPRATARAIGRMRAAGAELSGEAQP